MNFIWHEHILNRIHIAKIIELKYSCVLHVQIMLKYDV